MFKLVVISGLVAVAACAFLPVSPYSSRPSRPASRAGSESQAAVIRSDSDTSPDGSHYQYSYETQNGIAAQEVGDLVGSGQEAGIAARGDYQYTSPEGVPVQISYVADLNGFQPSGSVLPTSPPIPPAILKSLAYIASQPQKAAIAAKKPYQLFGVAG